MILVFFALFIAFLIGYSVNSFFLGNKMKKSEFLLVSLVFGLIIMSYYVLIVSLISGSLELGVYSFLAIGISYSVYLIYKKFNYVNQILAGFKKYSPQSIFDAIKKKSWTEIIFIFLFVILFLDVFSKTFTYENGFYKVAVAGYGDIPYHMTQVSYFVHNQSFGLEDPVYAGISLKYSFLINLLSSSFYVLSKNFIFSFNLPALIFNLSGIILVYLLVSRIIKKVSVRICTFLIFFLGASISYLKVVNDKVFLGKNSLAEMANYILHLPYQIINGSAVYPEQSNVWSNFFTSALMHQRSFFFGFAAGLVTLMVLFLTYLHREKKYFYLLGILVGLLPLVHIHTFIALFIIIFAFWISAVIIKEEESIRGFFKSLSIGLIIALPSLYYLAFYQKFGEGFLSFRLGWMTEPGIGSVQYNPSGGSHLWDWLSFIWQNFGIFLPAVLAIAAIFFFRRTPFKENFKSNYLMLSLIIGSFLLWIVINLIKFQPWDVDNNKIFAYLMLTGAIIIGYYFDRLKFYGSKILMIILTIFIISTGVIDVLQRSSFANPPLYNIFTPEDQKAADWIVKNTSSNDLILTGGSHLNLVDSLAGKPVLMGYPGWLWSHSYKYQAREKDIAGMYKGGTGAEELFKKYNIKYIFIGPSERYDFKPNERFFDQNYPIVFQEGDIKIYKISQ